LHLDDLATDKVLVLWGRARPQDLYDVGAPLDRYGPDRLLDRLAAKDSGSPTRTFVDALRAIHRLGSTYWTEDGIAE
jgi:hypothetical protein